METDANPEYKKFLERLFMKIILKRLPRQEKV